MASIAADGLVLSASRMEQLVDDLTKWLDSPEAGIQSFSGAYPLARDGYSKLDLTFHDRADTISSDDKPVVTVLFALGRIRGEFSFVTDQSCLGLFAREARNVIAEDTE